MSFISKALEKDRGPIDKVAPEGDVARQPLERRPAEWKSVTRESFSLSRPPVPRPERDSDLAPTELIEVPDLDATDDSAFEDSAESTVPVMTSPVAPVPSGPRLPAPSPRRHEPAREGPRREEFPEAAETDEFDEEEAGPRRIPLPMIAGIIVAAALGVGFLAGQFGAGRNAGGEVPIALQTSAGAPPVMIGSTRASSQPTPLVIRLEMGQGGETAAVPALPDVDAAALSAEQAQEQLASDLGAPGGAARPYRMTHNLLRRGYRVEGIFHSDDDPVAIINGETVREGTRFRDIRISRIGESSVTILYRDTEYELK